MAARVNASYCAAAERRFFARGSTGGRCDSRQDAPAPDRKLALRRLASAFPRLWGGPLSFPQYLNRLRKTNLDSWLVHVSPRSSLRSRSPFREGWIAVPLPLPRIPVRPAYGIL